MVVLAGGFALLVSGACWGCPSSPSSVSITVVPTNVPVFAGAPQEFSATGAPGPFNWSLPSGGGEIQPGSRTATVTAGATAGAYRVRATFQGNTGEAQFTVVTTR